MAETAEQEPTMEEILASIRRIISEDDEPAEEPKAAEPAKPAPAPAPAPAPPPKPVLAEKPKPKPAPPPPPPEPEPVEEEVLELTERVDEPEVIDDISFDEPARASDDGYVSTPVADAAAAAFGQLVGQMLVSSRGTEGKTLEDIVRELLKPMLRAWLDENLRQIVEARVAEEVERIAARGRR